MGYTTSAGGSIIDVSHSAVAAYNLGKCLQNPNGQASIGAVRAEFAIGAAADIEEAAKRRNSSKRRTDRPVSRKTAVFGSEKFLITGPILSFAGNNCIGTECIGGTSDGTVNEPSL